MFRPVWFYLQLGICAGLGCQSPQPAPVATRPPGKMEIVLLADKLPSVRDLQNAQHSARYSELCSRVDLIMRKLQPASSADLRKALEYLSHRARAAFEVAYESEPESSLKKFELPLTQSPGESRSDYLKRVSARCGVSPELGIWVDRFLFAAPTNFHRRDNDNFVCYPIDLYSPRTHWPNTEDLLYPLEQRPDGSLGFVSEGKLSYAMDVPFGPVAEFDSYAR